RHTRCLSDWSSDVCSSDLLRLEQATELNPRHEQYAASLEEKYRAAERVADLVAYLLRRAEKLDDKAGRAALRRRVAKIQKDELRSEERRVGKESRAKGGGG